MTTARMTEDVVAGYERAFEGAVPDEHIAELPEPIRVVMKRAVRRTWDGLFDERLAAVSGRSRSAAGLAAR